MMGQSPRLDLTTARLIVAIAEEGSIARAARRVFIVPSAVSKRLSELEQRLGVALVRRHRSGVELTVAGIAVVRRARNMLMEEEMLVQELHGISAGVQGHIRLIASESTLACYLPELLGDFLQQNPGIRVELQERQNPGIVRAVEDGDADLGIYAGTAPPTALWSQACQHDRLVAVMAEDHPLALLTELRMADILEHDVIAPEPTGMLFTHVTRQAAALGRPIGTRVRADGFDVVCLLAQARLGVGIVSHNAAMLLAPTLKIAVRPINEKWARREHRVCALRLDALSPAARLLLERLLRGGPLHLER